MRIEPILTSANFPDLFMNAIPPIMKMAAVGIFGYHG
jgi:hypothetical protein